MRTDNNHLDQEALVHLLWIAAPCSGASQALLHLVERCSKCFKPHDLKACAAEQHFDLETVQDLGERIASESSAETLGLLEHLLNLCPECSSVSADLRRSWEAGANQSWATDEFDGIASRLDERMKSWMERAPLEKREAHELCSQLVAQPHPRRLMLVRNSTKYLTWPVVDRLCEESLKAVSRDTEESVQLAEIAVEIAESLDPSQYGPAVTADIAARAWGYLANAKRVTNDLGEAAVAFTKAESCLARGTGLEHNRAEILHLKSSLHSMQGEFDKALVLARESRQIYRSLGDLHMQGRMFLIDAGIYSHKGESEQAILSLKEASKLVDIDREPRLLLCAKQNLVTFLANLERYDEAEALLPATWEICRNVGSRLDTLRLRWTEATIDAGLGRLHRAEITFTEIKEAFKGLDMPYDSALAGLELALIYSQQGRAREMKLLALEMLPVFARNEIHREALAAMTLFAKAAAVEQATQEVVEKTLVSLRKAAGHG